MDGSSTLSLNGRPRAGGGGALAPRRSTRSLVLWSAGVDSTYALKRLLDETGDEVYSHHVALDRAGMRGETCLRSRYEELALVQLTGALAACSRAFVHTRSRVDLRGAGSARGQAALLAFLGAHAAMAHGFTPFDRILVGVNADADPGWAPDSAACALRRARLSRALRAAWGCDDVPHVYLWEPRPRKAEMVDYLGEELAALTVSCLRPREPAEGGGGRLEACGQCAKCRARAAWERPAGVPAATPPRAAVPAPAFRDLLHAHDTATGGEA